MARYSSSQQPSGCCLTFVVILAISLFFTFLLGAVHMEDQRLQRERLGAARKSGGGGNAPIDVSQERNFPRDWSRPGALSRHTRHYGLYRLVPPVCPPNTTLFIWVHSSADHFSQRRLVRATWADMEYFRRELGIGVAYAFGVALPTAADAAPPSDDRNSSTLQRLLEEEFALHKDTVEMSFVESYYNVTYKAMGGLWYSSRRCPSSALYLKVDDDTFIVRNRLVHFLRLVLAADSHGRLNNTYSRTMMALFSPTAWTMPTRDKFMRNYISETEWPLGKFANHGAPGLAYFITSDLLSDLLRVANQVRWIWLEDVFILGILREELLRQGQPVRMLSLAPNIVHLYYNAKNKHKDIFANRQKIFVGDHPSAKWMSSFQYFEANG